MSRDWLAMLFMTVLSAVMALVFLVAVVLVRHAYSHEGIDAQVDEFYQRWMVPTYRDDKGARISSCCNKEDCHVAEVQYRGKDIYARTRASFPEWLLVPQNRVEQNQPDPQESPDGQSHLCHNPTGVVYCFTFGSGT